MPHAIPMGVGNYATRLVITLTIIPASPVAGRQFHVEWIGGTVEESGKYLCPRRPQLDCTRIAEILLHVPAC